MAMAHMKLAHLDETRLERLRTLEDDLGLHILALEPEVRLADLSEEAFEQLRAGEDELGVVLVAYERAG